MRRVFLVAALLACGCYDLDGLTRSYTSAGHDLGGAGGTGGSGGGGGSGGAAGDMGGTFDVDGGWRAIASPTTQALRGVSGDATGVLAVGAGSTVLRLSASGAPVAETPPPGYNLRAVTGGISAVAVGDSGAVLARSTGSWSDEGIGDATFYAVTLLGDGQPLAVGSGGTVQQRTMSGWLGQDPGTSVQLDGAWTRASGDVIVVGAQGTILYGAAGAPLTWSAQPSPVASDLFAVWGSGSDAWAVGAGGVVLHASGGAFSVEASGTTADLFGVAGAGGVVWAVGARGVIIARRNGAWALEHAGGPSLRAVFADGNGAWAVGDGGTILHR